MCSPTVADAAATTGRRYIVIVRNETFDENPPASASLTHMRAVRKASVQLEETNMPRKYQLRGITRRDAIRTATAAGIAAGVSPFVQVRPARAAKTLRILQWSHFVPAYDKWFNETYIKEWGKKNDTEVIVDNINLTLIESRAAAEVSAQKGHDLFMFLSPPAVFENQVVDMKDVYAECEKKHGKPIDLAIKSTYNPKTKRYFAFSDSFVPDPVNYRTDLWGEIGMKPDTWEDIRAGGKKIKEKTGIPVGIGLSAELDSAMAMRAIMYSFGSSVQDAEGNLAINSPQTLEALKFVKALFQEAMTPEVLAWDPSSNNRQMLAGRSSLVLNAISVTRTGENNKMNIHEKIGLAKAAKGPVRRIGLEHVMDCYVIWKFAENIDGPRNSWSITSAILSRPSSPASSTTSRASPARSPT
jgi:multiple sugar transport system substrate-binding protein